MAVTFSGFEREKYDLRWFYELVGFGLTGVALVSLPIQGWSGRVLAFLGYLPFDVLVACAVVFSIPRLVGVCRSFLIARTALAPGLVLAGAGLVSELAQASTAHLATRLAAQLAPLVVVWLVAAQGRNSRRRRGLLICLAAGTAVSAIVGLVGWGWDFIHQTALYSHRSSHPAFGHFPRLLGTVASSPQRAGNLFVVGLASLWAISLEVTKAKQRVCKGGLIAMGVAFVLALTLTASFAWVGAAVLAVGGLWKCGVSSGKHRVSLLLAVGLLVAVASYPMTVGTVSERLRGECSSVDAAHYVAVITPSAVGGGAPRCTRLSQQGRAVPTYWHAKLVSWQAFAQRPWFGVGLSGFADYAVQQFHRKQGATGSFYRQPHGIYHGLPAKHGVLGLLAVFLMLLALAWGWRSGPWDWAVAAFFVMGLHFDVDRLRELWVVWGVMAGCQLSKGCGQGKVTT